MKQEALLEERDARTIVSLLGEVAAICGDHIVKKRHLMNRLCELIDADRWAWGLAAQMDPEKPSIHISLLHGGFTESTYAAFTQAYSHPAMSAIHAPFARELQEQRCHLTRLREQIDPQETVKSSEAGPFWAQADINGVIFSLRPINESHFAVVGIYRRLAAPTFNLRENRIAHIVLSSVPSLHTHGWPDGTCVILPELSIRKRVVVDLLVQGYSRRKIADHLEISLHTVNDYVKAIFSHFGVHSQSELVAYFHHGDGGDG